MLGAMLEAIRTAQRSIRLETYIFATDTTGRSFRDALTAAARRGVDVALLIGEFSAQWARADSLRWQLAPGGYARACGTDSRASALCIKPGFGPSALRTALREDLAAAQDIAIATAYFLPGDRFLRQLRQAVRRGARVRLLLAGPSDVAIAALAGRSLYRRLLRDGIELHEYQPQVLHAKYLPGAGRDGLHRLLQPGSPQPAA